MAEAIRAVVVTMFGDQTPPTAGETAAIREARKMVAVSAGTFPLYREGAVLLLQAGVGPANTAARVMALAHDLRWDVSSARWIVAGVAGFDPGAAALGSVCLGDHLVDGDLAFEFAGPDVPSDWSTGVLPLGARKPFDETARDLRLVDDPYFHFDLRGKAFAEARERLAGVEWQQDETARAESCRYPEVSPTGEATGLTGAILSAGRFWHGHTANHWARAWVHYWTKGEGRFVASGMEDSGTLVALRELQRAGRVGSDSVVILRAASNFTVPPPGVDAVTSLTGARDDYAAPGMAVALSNLTRAVRALLD